MVRHWKRLPKKVVAALFLEIFKARLNGALNKLIQQKVSLSMARRAELYDL